LHLDKIKNPAAGRLWGGVNEVFPLTLPFLYRCHNKEKHLCLCPEQPGTFCGLIRAVGGEVGLEYKDKEKQ
jgi:hypothetical protein